MLDSQSNDPRPTQDGRYSTRPALYIPPDPPWYDAPIGALLLVAGGLLACWATLHLGLLFFRVGLSIFSG